MSLIEKLSISYLKSDAGLNPSDIDYVKLDQIKTIGKILVLISSLLSIYVGYLILESWFGGILIGLCFMIIYLNFYLVLLSTIRKSDFISSKKPIVSEKIVTVNGISLTGDLRSYDETKESKKPFFSIIFRLFFLLILSSFLSISAVLISHQNVAEKGIIAFKEESSTIYIDFLSNTFKAKKQKEIDRLNQLNKKLNVLETKKDSISNLLNTSPQDESLREEIIWAKSDLNDFNNQYQDEIIFLNSNIKKSDDLLLEKSETYKQNISNSLFFIQRIKFLFHQYFFTSFLVFVFFLCFLCLPFFLRLKMLKSAKYTMDDKLQDFTKAIIERNHHQLIKEIEVLTKNEKYEEFLKKYHFSSWPIHEDHFEDSPFNTIPKIDNRIKLRKGSLATYLKKTL